MASAGYLAIGATGRRAVRRLARRCTPTAARRSPPTRPASAPRWSRSALAGGVTDAAALADAVDDDTAAVFLQQPNFLGAVEDIAALAAAREGERARWSSSPSTRSTLGVLRPPGECGADIAVGEGQPLGGRLDFGGPSFGFFCATEEHIRRMPGRIAGETMDVDGRRGFVLALQTREQHIRREKATHNICTAQALNALAGVVYLSWLGKRGLVELGELLVQPDRLRARAPGRARRRRAAARRAGGARVRGPARRAGRRGARPLRRRGHRRRAIRSAASTPSTRTACWSRSPSGAAARTSTGSPTVARAAPSAERARRRRGHRRGGVVSDAATPPALDGRPRCSATAR